MKFFKKNRIDCLFVGDLLVQTTNWGSESERKSSTRKLEGDEKQHNEPDNIYRGFRTEQEKLYIESSSSSNTNS